MIKMKVGGMILTGCAAFLMVSKVVNSLNSAVNKVCETAKWRGYYKCWSKGEASGEPVVPGYSVTTRPDGANYEVVKDPEGKDHAHDNDPKTEDAAKSADAAKAVVDAVKTVAEKVMDNLTKPSDKPREASEGDLEASENDISDQAEVDLENVIEGTFNGEEKITEYDEDGNPVAGRYSWDTDGDNTVVVKEKEDETVD